MLKLTEMGDPLERLSKTVDFEMFRTELEDALLPKERKSNAGAKRYDVVMMFKLMVLQRYYNLSDEQAEFQIVDRTSFRRFLGLSDGDRVPDARTIWLFRERLAKSGKVGDLFQMFVDYLNGKGLIFSEGRMIDASFVSVPKQRNTPDENKRIKAGEGGDRADQPNLQHVALRANRQAQPTERLTKKQLSDTYIHTYIRTNPQKNEQKACHIKLKCIPLQRVEGIAQTGLRHPDNPETSQSSIIRSPLKS